MIRGKRLTYLHTGMADCNGVCVWEGGGSESGEWFREGGGGQKGGSEGKFVAVWRQWSHAQGKRLVIRRKAPHHCTGFPLILGQVKSDIMAHSAVSPYPSCILHQVMRGHV